MATPVLITVPKDTWTKVLTNVKLGNVWIIDNAAEYYQTYRDSGDAAPTSDAEAVWLPRPGAGVESSIDIDVYILTRKTDGVVRVDY